MQFLLQSYVDSGDYDDEEDYPDLNERLEAYKSKYLEARSCRANCVFFGLFTRGITSMLIQKITSFSRII